jgi:hypothetical protein
MEGEEQMEGGKNTWVNLSSSTVNILMKCIKHLECQGE